MKILLTLLLLLSPIANAYDLSPMSPYDGSETKIKWSLVGIDKFPHATYRVFQSRRMIPDFKDSRSYKYEYTYHNNNEFVTLGKEFISTVHIGIYVNEYGYIDGRFIRNNKIAKVYYHFPNGNTHRVPFNRDPNSEGLILHEPLPEINKTVVHVISVDKKYEVYTIYTQDYMAGNGSKYLIDALSERIEIGSLNPRPNMLIELRPILSKSAYEKFQFKTEDK